MDVIGKNRDNLISDEGYKEYQKRMHTVEPVFGNIKFNLGFRQFLVRGTSKVKGEFDLMCIAHNIKKIATYCDKHSISYDACLAQVPGRLEKWNKTSNPPGVSGFEHLNCLL